MTSSRAVGVMCDVQREEDPESRRAFLSGVLATAAAAQVSAFASACQPAAEAANAPVATERPRPKITISRETTFLEGPLRADGTVDYLAAINAHCGRGVTPENNAAVALWQAVGPREIPAAGREQFFRMLGIPALPEDGQYLVPFSKLVSQITGDGQADEPATEDSRRAQELYDEYDRVEQKPWSKKEFPTFARWLADNERPLALVVQGSRRPRFYSPLVPEHSSLLIENLALPALTQTREVVWQLAIRAMGRLHEGLVEEAWEDVLACHRWARLYGQQSYVVDLLTSNALEGIACRGDVGLVYFGNLTPEQARRFLADLQGLSPRPRIIDKLQFGERLIGLDCVQEAARVGRLPDTPSNHFMQQEAKEAMIKLAADPRVDWGHCLRLCNTDYDRLVAAVGKRTHAERREALEKLSKEAETRSQKARDLAALKRLFSRDSTPGVETARHLHAVLCDSIIVFGGRVADFEARAATLLQLSQLAFAIETYRGEHGSYPERLSALAPQYCAEVPKDIFTGGDLQYKVQGKGYLLYSCGPNGKDDGGRNDIFNPPPDGQEIDPKLMADDIAIRTPGEHDPK